ncbi:MAG: type VI secretion system protein ImpG [Methyloprofundus sp.]|nr:MAG: type VI secretion system protein ImpG [Methyloprofundus sp.]
MIPRFLEYYQRELQFIREMGSEFAQQYPKIAASLDLGGTECADPYVERLLESFAFLTARIQLKMDAEFPRFTQHLLEIVYPHYLAPLPSMAVVQIQPDLKGGVTENGFILPRQTRLLSHSNVKGRSKCEFRTAHELTLWPIQIKEASYLPLGEALRYAGSGINGVKAGIRLKLQTVQDFTFQQLNIENLPMYLHGSGSLPFQLYELLLGHCVAVVLQGKNKSSQAYRKVLNKTSIQALGFDAEQALLPGKSASFQGYRLLQEYFALPQRYLFVDIAQLQPALQDCNATEIEIVILLDHNISKFEGLIGVSHFMLNCTPAINLFPKRTDRIHLKQQSTEHHIVVDRTKPNDFEVFSLKDVEGYAVGTTTEQVFRPFYSSQQDMGVGDCAYYTIRRQQTLEPTTSRVGKLKTDYIGSEAFISLVDASEAPYSTELKQLGLEALCTNRDLPKMMMLGEGKTDFNWVVNAPIEAVRCLAGPTDPEPSHAEGEHAWRLINHLSLNYLSLVNNDSKQGATVLRDLLRLYGNYAEPSIGQQIEGLISVNSKVVTVRIPVSGPMCFGRGLEITLNFDESAFVGAGCFLLGAVMEQFFRKYASINSFTQLVIKTRERGEIMRWPVRTGTRATL